MAHSGSLNVPATSCTYRTSVAAFSMLPAPSQLKVTEFPVRPSATATRWICSAADTTSGSASLSTASEVQDKWKAALASAIGGNAVLQQDGSLRELLQVYCARAHGLFIMHTRPPILASACAAHHARTREP